MLWNYDSFRQPELRQAGCDYFHNAARELNQKWHTEVPDEWRLAFLPVDTVEGKQYVNWMNLALDFAAENRSKMKYAVRAIVEK